MRRAIDRRVTGWVKLAQFVGDWAAWACVSEAEAKSAPADEFAHRIRTPGQPWCDWLGPDISVAADLVVQAYFATVPDDQWPRLATAIRRDQRKTVAEWREAGQRLLAAAAGAPPPRQPRPHPIALAFTTRGPGRRSLPVM
jgi:hypothetical protein